VGDLETRSDLLPALLTSFRYHKDLADRAVAQLPDAQLHVALDHNTNSIAVTMKHVAGNLRSRWIDFLTSDGEKTWRNRDDEFVDSYRDRDELMQDWESGWRCTFESLSALKPDDFSKQVAIRGERLSVPLAACRSLAHTAYHVGQIVLIARVLADRAGVTWKTLTIPRGGSREHNERVWGREQYASGSSSAATGQQ
jgi:hypothetical protein